MKRTKKILLRTAAITTGLVALVVVGLMLFFPLEKVQTLLVEQATQTLNREVKVGKLELSLWGGLGVKLNQVSVGNPQGWDGGQMLLADAVDAKLRLWPLISGEYRVDRLIVDHPYLTLHKQPDGVINYALRAVDRSLPADIAQTVTDETKTAMAVITFDRLEVKQGVVEYRDDSSGVAFTATGLSLSTTLESSRANRYTSQGEISIDSLQVTSESFGTTVALTVEYEAQYNHEAREVTLTRAEIGINDLNLNLDGWAQLAPDGWNVRMDAKSQDAGIGDLLALLPPERLANMDDLNVEGRFDFQATVERQAEREDPLSYSGTAVLNDLVVSSGLVPGSLRIGRALLDFKPENLRLNIEDGTFEGRPLRGHLIIDNFDDPMLNGELAGTLDLALVQPFLPPEDQHQLTGQTDLAVKFSGPANRPDEMRLSGSLNLSAGTYKSLLLPEPVTALDIEAIFDNDLIRLDRFQAVLPSGQMNFTGRLYNLVPMMMADSGIAAAMPLNIDGKVACNLDMHILNGLLADDTLTALAGLIAIEAELAGDLKDWRSLDPRGRVTVKEGGYASPGLPEPIKSLELDIEFTADTARVNSLNLQFPSSDLSMTGKVIHPWPYLVPTDSAHLTSAQKPYMTFALKSTRLDVDRLFPEIAPGSGNERAAQSVDSLPPMVLPLIDGIGTMAIDTLIYCQVEFTNIAGDVEIRDRRVVCDKVRAAVYTGTVTGNTEIDFEDFENPHYKGQFQAQQIEANDFVDRFTKFGGYFFGKVNFDGTYDASGWDAEPLLQSLTLSGDMLMNQGQVTTSGAVHSAISTLAEKVGESFSENQTLRNLSTKVQVINGRVHLNDLVTSLGELGDVTLAGSYGFDGSLDYGGSLLLSTAWSEKLMAQGGVGGVIGRLFSDSKTERIRLPVKVSRTIGNPQVELDYNALSKQAGEKLLEKGTGLLDKLRKN
ncbi:MAG: AsmA family protein [bacterium]